MSENPIKIMIEVSGGNLCNITATDEASIYILDYDNIEADLDSIKTLNHLFARREALRAIVDDLHQAQQPDRICSLVEFYDLLGEEIEKAVQSLKDKIDAKTLMEYRRKVENEKHPK